MGKRAAVIKHSHEDAEAMLHRVRAYLPDNYRADLVDNVVDAGILIYGEDKAGWTLDGYVIPRLASGLIYPQEVEV